MSAALAHTRAMTLRHLRELWRQPWFVAIMLVQPLIWLLLFGSLFERVVQIPGFGGGDYVDFLTQQSLAPGWVQSVARFNPVNWAVEAGRESLGTDVAWGVVGSRALLLVLLAVLCGWVATTAFRSYQRSV